MNPDAFYQKTAERNTFLSDALIPEPIEFVGRWGKRSRIQIAYEMLAPYAPFSKLLDIGCGDLENLINLESLFKKGYGVDIATYPNWSLLSDRFEIYKHNLDESNLLFESNTFDGVSTPIQI
jgi:hypothetical protein